MHGNFPESYRRHGLILELHETELSREWAGTWPDFREINLRLGALTDKENEMLEQEGYNFMGAAFEVYNEIGYGMAEAVYQDSLKVELQLRNIPFVSQKYLEVFYKGHLLESAYIPDFLVYGKIIVDLKAVKNLLPEHEAQVFNYMRISRKHVGYLVNYGSPDGLVWKRFILSDLHDKNQHRRAEAER